MYAVISSGGKQYRVSEGETLRVEKLAGGPVEGHFRSAAVRRRRGGVQVGQPTVKGVTVEAEILDQGLAKKIIIFKYKRRKSYRRKQGHRQPYTALKITAIRAGARRKRSAMAHKKGQGFIPQRPRFAVAAPRGQAPRRRDRARGQHPGSPGRHRDPPRLQRRHGT